MSIVYRSGVLLHCDWDSGAEVLPRTLLLSPRFMMAEVMSLTFSLLLLVSVVCSIIHLSSLLLCSLTRLSTRASTLAQIHVSDPRVRVYARVSAAQRRKGKEKKPQSSNNQRLQKLQKNKKLPTSLPLLHPFLHSQSVIFPASSLSN